MGEEGERIRNTLFDKGEGRAEERERDRLKNWSKLVLYAQPTGAIIRAMKN